MWRGGRQRAACGVMGEGAWAETARVGSLMREDGRDGRRAACIEAVVAGGRRWVGARDRRLLRSTVWRASEDKETLHQPASRTEILQRHTCRSQRQDGARLPRPITGAAGCGARWGTGRGTMAALLPLRPAPRRPPARPGTSPARPQHAPLAPPTAAPAASPLVAPWAVDLGRTWLHRPCTCCCCLVLCPPCSIRPRPARDMRCSSMPFVRVPMCLSPSRPSRPSRLPRHVNAALLLLLHSVALSYRRPSLPAFVLCVVLGLSSLHGLLSSSQIHHPSLLVPLVHRP